MEDLIIIGSWRETHWSWVLKPHQFLLGQVALPKRQVSPSGARAWVTQAQCVRCVVPSPKQIAQTPRGRSGMASTEAGPKHHVAQGCVQHRSRTQAPRVRSSVVSTEARPKRHVGARREHSPQVSTQVPRVHMWFFFNSNNSFLKFINDDNNNSNF